jgi:hypothetical protein
MRKFNGRRKTSMGETAPGPWLSEQPREQGHSGRIYGRAMKKRRNKGSRRQVAAIREKEEGNHDRCWRVDFKTAIPSRKKRVGLQDSQKDPRAGIREESNRDVRRVAEGEKLVAVEVSTSSGTKNKDYTLWSGRLLPKRKKKAGNRGGAGNVEVPAKKLALNLDQT